MPERDNPRKSALTDPLRSPFEGIAQEAKLAKQIESLETELEALLRRASAVEEKPAQPKTAPKRRVSTPNKPAAKAPKAAAFSEGENWLTKLNDDERGETFQSSRSYCYDKEMSRALELHQAGSAVVISMILRAVDWEAAPFHELQALPKDAVSITAWQIGIQHGAMWHAASAKRRKSASEAPLLRRD